MSATNTTTNYNLPIFIGSDKPSWLADFNGAMNAIDAQMKVNADAIATKSPILTFNDTSEIDFTKSGNVITANLASGVSDKVGRALVTPIAAPAAEQLVAIDTNGSQSAIDIGTGLFNNSGVLTAVDLNLTDMGSVTPTTGLPSGISYVNGTISYAFNSDRSIGKIYGSIQYKKTTSGDLNQGEFDTGIIVPAPDSEYSIVPAGITLLAGSYHFAGVTFKVKTNGHVYISTSYWANATIYIYIPPCIYFFKDFGDTPTP